MLARSIVLAALAAIALLVETVVTPALAIAGWRPDLVALLVVAVGLVEGPGTGVRFGFAAGLAQDLLSGAAQLVGLWALLLLVVGQLAGLSRPYTSAAGTPGRALAAGVLSGGAALAYGAIDRVLGASTLAWEQLAVGVLVVAAWAALLSPAVLRGVTALLRRFPPGGPATSTIDGPTRS